MHESAQIDCSPRKTHDLKLFGFGLQTQSTYQATIIPDGLMDSGAPKQHTRAKQA